MYKALTDLRKEALCPILCSGDCSVEHSLHRLRLWRTLHTKGTWIEQFDVLCDTRSQQQLLSIMVYFNYQYFTIKRSSTNTKKPRQALACCAYPACWTVLFTTLIRDDWSHSDRTQIVSNTTGFILRIVEVIIFHFFLCWRIFLTYLVTRDPCIHFIHIFETPSKK